MKSTICGMLGAVGSGVAYLFGGWDSSVITLLMFMMIDYISGLVVAGVFHKSTKTESGTLSSAKCWQGLSKKCMTLVFVIIGFRLDMLIGSSYIRDAVCIAFIVNETISIMENAKLMGIPLPDVLTKALDILHKRGAENDNN